MEQDNLKELTEKLTRHHAQYMEYWQQFVVVFLDGGSETKGHGKIYTPEEAEKLEGMYRELEQVEREWFNALKKRASQR